MKVHSFIRQGYELAPVEVELSLTPGLPHFQFIGLPDLAIRESALRIRSAIREQGFDLPIAQSILVNLQPTHLKKSSRGLDLAIAAALLWEMGQVARPQREPVVYGELTLKGEVRTPDDTNEIETSFENRDFFTGAHETARFASYQLKSLRDLIQPQQIEPHPVSHFWQRPLPAVSAFPKTAAEIAMVVAAGEHSLLLAGPPGSGKSTLADAIPTFLQKPDESLAQMMAKIARATPGVELKWRPILKPHHSVTPIAMIGGGAALWQGEITRAHGGVLIMDELLEFHPEIQDALREPVETGEITIVRAGGRRVLPAQILLLATTNLCPCGKFVPRRTSMKCRCRARDRQAILKRLTGPFTDRFQIVALTDDWSESEEKISSAEILQRVSRAIEFRKNERAQLTPNARIDAAEIAKTLSDFQRAQLLDFGDQSRRRKNSVLRLARTLADLRADQKISNADLEQAINLGLRAHRLLTDWSD